MTRNIPKVGLPQSTEPVFDERTQTRKKAGRPSFLLIFGIALGGITMIVHTYLLLVWTIVASHETGPHFFVIVPYVSWLVSPILHTLALLMFRKWPTRSAICLTIVAGWLLVFGLTGAYGFRIPAAAVVYMLGSGLTLAIAYRVYVEGNK